MTTAYQQRKILQGGGDEPWNGEGRRKDSNELVMDLLEPPLKTASIFVQKDLQWKLELG